MGCWHKNCSNLYDKPKSSCAKVWDRRNQSGALWECLHQFVYRWRNEARQEKTSVPTVEQRRFCHVMGKLWSLWYWRHWMHHEDETRRLSWTKVSVRKSSLRCFFWVFKQHNESKHTSSTTQLMDTFGERWNLPMQKIISAPHTTYGKLWHSSDYTQLSFLFVLISVLYNLKTIYVTVHGQLLAHVIGNSGQNAPGVVAILNQSRRGVKPSCRQ